MLQDNPSDTALLKAGVKGHKRLFRRRLKAVAADRGFYSQANEDWLKDRGVKQAGIPKRGKISGERLFGHRENMLANWILLSISWGTS